MNSQEVIFQITIDREALATQEASEAFIRRHSFGGRRTLEAATFKLSEARDDVDQFKSCLGLRL